MHDKDNMQARLNSVYAEAEKLSKQRNDYLVGRLMYKENLQK